MRHWTALVVWVFAGALVGSAPSTGGAYDQRTPRAAVLSLNRAIEDGDWEAVRQLCTGSAGPVRLLEAAARRSLALHRMEAAATRRWGAAAAHPLITPAHALLEPGEAERIKDSDVTIDGERARIRLPETGTMCARRIDGLWRIVPGNLEGVAPLRVFRAEARAASLVTSNIEAGEYASATDAAEAYRRQLDRVLPTMEPATRPSRDPD